MMFTRGGAMATLSLCAILSAMPAAAQDDFCAVREQLGGAPCAPGEAGASGGVSLQGPTQGLSIQPVDPGAQQQQQSGAAGQQQAGAAVQAPRGGQVQQPLVQSQAVSVPPSPDQPRSASLATVQFELGSATLRPDATQALQMLAAVLADPSLSQSRFIIEGHTDASGPANVNQALSERRAQAVVGYLVSNEGVDPGRLIWAGKGESQPIDPANPYAAANRRVVVLNIGQ